MHDTHEKYPKRRQLSAGPLSNSYGDNDRLTNEDSDMCSSDQTEGNARVAEVSWVAFISFH